MITRFEIYDKEGFEIGVIEKDYIINLNIGDSVFTTEHADSKVTLKEFFLDRNKMLYYLEIH